MYDYKAEQILSIDLKTAWNFFSSAKNLAIITPPELGFKIRTPLIEEEIYNGMRIEYTVKPLMGIPLQWVTEIQEVKRWAHFTDVQIKGPYKIWKHTHTFIEEKEGVRMFDQIQYQLPFGILGRLAHRFIVRKKIERIFTFRKEVLNKLFLQNGNHHH